MEQQFHLKYYGKLSIFEQAQMTAEERSWWARRLNKEREAEAKAGKQAKSGIGKSGKTAAD